jgi:hypothetical protein
VNIRSNTCDSKTRRIPSHEESDVVHRTFVRRKTPAAKSDFAAGDYGMIIPIDLLLLQDDARSWRENAQVHRIAFHIKGEAVLA